MTTVQVQAVPDDEMPAGVDWAVVKSDDELVILLREGVAWPCEERRRLNAALRRAS